MFEFFEKKQDNLPDLDDPENLTQADLDQVNANNPPYEVKSIAHLLMLHRNWMRHQQPPIPNNQNDDTPTQ